MEHAEHCVWGPHKVYHQGLERIGVVWNIWSISTENQVPVSKLRQQLVP